MIPKLVRRVILSVAGIFCILTAFGCHRGTAIEQRVSAVELKENTFSMIHLPAMTIPAGPTGRVLLEENRPETLQVEHPLRLAQTNTTWALWSEVYTWGIRHGYIFNRPGQPGTENDGKGMNERHPVTVVDWPSVMVWCNALTEYYNELHGTSLAPVYQYSDGIARDASNRKESDTVAMNKAAGGFRLPTGPEWELAARYSTVKRAGYREYPRGSGNFWKPWLVVSGEIENSVGAAGGDRGRIKSVEVTETAINDLGFYGMEGKEGKLWQWCFEYLKSDKRDSFRLKMGGSRGPRCSRHDNWPKTKWSPTCSAYNQITFRTAQTED